MNYAALTRAILAETENNDSTFGANIYLFVQNAEKRIYQAIKAPAWRKSQTSALQNATQYLTLPTDYISTWELATKAGGSYTYLLPKDVSFIREAYPVPANTGTPKYYAQFDSNTLLIGPTPNAAIPVELHYFYYPESIVTANTTWLGDNFDNVLLYGALVEAAIFMKSEADIVGGYTEQYGVNLKLLDAYAKDKLSSGNYRK